ncbi:hypothetical protein ACIO6U_03685 [Streptomyces sp. NPDC087422]|uniref:hypothetical protein n=1 Tax=Streptomyces sp. NPDC087422 TaxID=3365786 RepID=UPI0037F7EE2E
MTSDLLAADLAPDFGPTADPVELAWYGCDLKSGGIIEELPAVTPTQPLGRKLGTVTTGAASLALAGAPRGWEEATTDGLCMLVAVDTATDTPVWPGIILTRAGGSADTVDLQMVTPEAYFDRRYTGDIAMVGQDQATVMAAVMASAFTDGPCFVLDSVATGVQMGYSVADSDDRTCLSAAQELMAMQGGPEMTVDVAWNTEHNGFVLPVRIRAAIGTQTQTPEGTFDFPGAVSNYVLAESYEQGKGSNVIVARGEGEGTSRLSSSPYSAVDLIAAGWCRWTYRYTPAQGVTDPAQLNAHAASSLALMRLGSQVWSLEATASRAPRIGRDFVLGDSVRLAVEHSPRHPRGADVVARCWSWQLDPGADTITPILVQED